MILTRRSLLLGAGSLAASALIPEVTFGAVKIWDNGGDEPYRYDPAKPLREEHIKWDPEINAEFLKAMENGWFETTIIKDGTDWNGMYFGDDKVIQGGLVARPSNWKPGRSHLMREYYAQTAQFSAIYSVPEVCGNPSWKVLKGTQPLCIPRPKCSTCG